MKALKELAEGHPILGALPEKIAKPARKRLTESEDDCTYSMASSPVNISMTLMHDLRSCQAYGVLFR